jgi:hypothetical protein
MQAMLIGEARSLARAWIDDQVHGLPGFQGAFLTGSAIWRSPDDDLPPTSDVDMMVVLEGPLPPVKLGKVLYRGLLLDVTYLAAQELDSPDDVLGSYYLAPSFARPSIVVDPTGRLRELSEVVSKEYHRRRWITRRSEHGWSNAARYFGALSATLPLHDQVIIWLFGTAASTIVLLCAGLRNPTVRTRYLAVRQLLADYGLLHRYEPLLGALGCARMSREQVECHLDALEPVFDAAARLVRSPFFFASDISAIARPISIGGSRDLIERGYHREAIFWIAATFARCDKILYHDASPVERDDHLGSFLALLEDLGVGSTAELLERARQVEEQAPRVWETAEAIMAANSEVVD